MLSNTPRTATKKAGKTPRRPGYTDLCKLTKATNGSMEQTYTEPKKKRNSKFKYEYLQKYSVWQKIDLTTQLSNHS